MFLCIVFLFLIVSVRPEPCPETCYQIDSLRDHVLFHELDCPFAYGGGPMMICEEEKPCKTTMMESDLFMFGLELDQVRYIDIRRGVWRN